MVRPNSSQACAKWSINLWSTSSARVARAGVVDKDGLSNGDVPDLVLGSESGQVEQSAIRLSVQVDSVFVLAQGGGQEHQEEAPKEGGGRARSSA